MSGAAVIFGGYGTFGRQVAQALAGLSADLVIAGRDQARAQAMARALVPPQRATAADVNDAQSCLAALRGQRVAVNCAGPFQGFGTALLEACLRAGCHYVDISDDRAHAARVRSWHDRFAAQGLAAVYGCSSLPGLSGALGQRAAVADSAPPERARVTLFIGNRNPKGRAAIASLVCGLGRPIEAPQGRLFGFRHGETVTLPAPFGRRRAFPFESPDYDLLPRLVGAQAVSVLVAFELRIATRVLALLAAAPASYGPRTARLLACLGRPVGWLGCSGGAVMTELFSGPRSARWAALVARERGQRMVAWPCALVARELLSCDAAPSGTFTAYEFLGADRLLNEVCAAGFELFEGPAGPRS